MDMVSTRGIPVVRIKNSRLQEVDFSHLEFGKYVSDHMFVAEYKKGTWHNAQVMPFEDIQLSPAALGLHYGQTVFEGMKAFRMQDGSINIFRMDKHYDRFVRSLERMCMAVPSKELFISSMTTLLETDKSWVPEKPGDAMYIRPFMFASEARFGIKISDEYRFIIFTGPVPALYTEPIRIKLETTYVRAVKGGAGAAKCGGNYGAAYYPTRIAREEGYDQVLWTDGRTHEYIEESGMMNMFFVMNDTLVTAALSDSILDGVTRDSLITIAKDMGYPVNERQVSVAELEEAFKKGTITAAFGAGTAAVVAPVKTIHINGIDYSLQDYKPDNIMFILKDRLNSMRTGLLSDSFGWNHII